MKKAVTIVIVILLTLGFGYFLFKISPQEKQQIQNAAADFDLSQVKSISEPGPINPQDHIAGDVNAKNIFIAYEDYQCPACAQTASLVKQVPQAFTDTKVVFRHFPLYQIHKNSVISAYAAEAAAAQGKYWEMHDSLFEKQADWSELENPLGYFAALAQQAGVSNIDQFKNDITSKKFKERIQKDLVEALSLDLPGTPSFYFNGHKLENNSLENMKAQAAPYFIK